MRVRGLIFIAAAIPAWIYLWYFWREANRIGSVESIPAFVIGVGWFACLSPLLGVSLLVVDGIKRMRGRSQ
jgi:hypothetical protein